MRYHGILVHYAEIAIKGHNRGGLVRGLMSNLRRALVGMPLGGIERESGRIWIYPRPDAEFTEAALSAIGRVVGVANYAPALVCATELPDIKETALSLVQEQTYDSFRVRARRVFRQQPFGSLEVDRDVGEFLLERKPAQVKMRNAALEVFIEMLPQRTFIYCDRREGRAACRWG